eukprot:gnl/MRDRNA2_/MRDRNA2_31573_c0_seq1.p1 gnl/MRDRNA2_/MRDRNA2_31573_c0~~gnl/MRDRNA2_/MRDRNA2_31573_c0_seq1.p1  ORF type:complete len:430 (+),score=76.53 gnl/MRDRNA2_/MRDRNA2_31573_c0_seq1:120-1409(+)
MIRSHSFSECRLPRHGMVRSVNFIVLVCLLSHVLAEQSYVSNTQDGMDAIVDKLANKLVSKLFNQVLKASPLGHVSIAQRIPQHNAVARHPSMPSFTFQPAPLHLAMSQQSIKAGNIWLPRIGHSMQAPMFGKLHDGKLAAEEDSAGMVAEDDAAGSPDSTTPYNPPDSKCIDNGKRFHGFIKMFKEEAGFGFIHCDETRERFARDIFLDIAYKEGFKVGDPISFRIFEKKNGKTEAVSLSSETHLTHEEAVEYQKGPVAETGWFKFWKSEKGFGFIQPSDGSESVYCKSENILDGVMPDQVNVADLVTYEKWYSSRKKQWHAFNVHLEKGRGVVRTKDYAAGFGYIEPSEGGAPLYFRFAPIKTTARVDPQNEKHPWSIPEYARTPDDETGKEVTYVKQFNDLKMGWMFAGREPARLYQEKVSASENQ